MSHRAGRTHSPHAAMLPLSLLLVLALILGGGSQGEPWMRIALNAFAALLLLWRVLDGRFGGLNHASWIIVSAILALALVMALQLVPLPPEIWTLLPGRQEVAKAYGALGAQLPWMAASMSPEQTFLSFYDLIPPLTAVTYASNLTTAKNGTGLMWLMGGLGAASAALGAAQVLSGGSESPLYLHQLTNRGLPTGFFANVNHQASFLLICTPFLFALLSRTVRQSTDDPAQRGLVAPIGLMIVLMLFGVATAGSIAGWVMSGLVLLFGLSLISRSIPAWMRIALPVGSVVSVAGLGLLVLSSPLLANKGIGISEDTTSISSRLSTTEVAAPLALKYFPVGSGFGSFRSVFALQENQDDVGFYFMNQAHDDWLEVVIEAGAAGLVFAVLIFGFLVFGCVRIWKAQGSRALLGRAASIGAIVLALHSFVDYPLRTSAIATVAAILALLIAQSGNQASSRKKGNSLMPQAHRQIVI